MNRYSKGNSSSAGGPQGGPRTGGVNNSTVTPSGREIGRPGGRGAGRGGGRGRGAGMGGLRRRNAGGMSILDPGDRGTITDTYPATQSTPQVPSVQPMAQHAKSPTRPVQSLEPGIAPPRNLAAGSMPDTSRRTGMTPDSSPLHSSVTRRRNRYGG